MKKTLYSKYTSQRAPKFQTSTRIVEEDGTRYVEKYPFNEAAGTHVERLSTREQLINELYGGKIKAVPCHKVENGGIRFDFIKGHSLFTGVDFAKLSMEEIEAIIKDKLEIVTDVAPQYRKKFEMSDGFREMFGELSKDPSPELDAFSAANLDSIFSNFIDDGETIWCADYEWVSEFDVPADYIRYRAIEYVYHENFSALKERITKEALLVGCGISPDDMELFTEMEKSFQDYVQGKDLKYMYTGRYKKPVEHIEDLRELIRLKDNHICNLEGIRGEQNVKIDQLQKAVDKYRYLMRHPVYALGWGIKKFCGKCVRYTYWHLLPHQIRDFRTKLNNHKRLRDNNKLYEGWITALEAKETYDETFSWNPIISVVIPVYNVSDKLLSECIESVRSQVYPYWELCMADDCSTMENVRPLMQKYANMDSRIKIVFRTENGHISHSTNSAIELATGEYIAFMDCDDTLSKNALYEVVKKLNEDPSIDFVYTDEDKIDENGQNRDMPHFKPDWSPDTLMSQMYTGHLGVYRRSIINDIGGLRVGYEGSQDHDMTLRFVEKTNKVAHVAKVLYHWRVTSNSTAGSIGAKPYVIEAQRKAKEDAVHRRGYEADLEMTTCMQQYCVNYKVKGNPMVSIIIPSKDHPDVLERLLKSMKAYTTYENYELVVVDNGSSPENYHKYQDLVASYGGKYHYEPMPFNFSKMCNLGAAHSQGEYYLFLNDDTEIIEEHGDWLARMLGQAQLPHTGAVGAKLYYPQNKEHPDARFIQHCGVVVIDNGPIHLFAGGIDSVNYYFGRNRLNYNWLCVTAACLMVNAEKFNEINGFAEDMAISYNDVDLCMRLYEAGYYNICRNDVILFHHESLSRGNDLIDKAKLERLMQEQLHLYEKHPKFKKKDPFYSRYLAQNRSDGTYNFENIGL